ncbi:vWA domain-containing protein [Nostoc sp.]|uniref:vWA domain-containing protein n=1 Tax=Nostoc sp. TaxID=1180 RepID=UPI002FF66AFD
MAVGQPEFPEFVNNPEPRCPVILLLDTSGSMKGKPIEELNKGIEVFKREIQQDPIAALRVEVAIITFGPVHLAQDFITIDDFISPVLTANNTTPMGEAIEYAMNLLEDRKETYRNNGMQYYQPWVFLITDGAPDLDSPWQRASQLVRRSDSEKKLSFFTVGVEGADMNILKQIAPPIRPPLMLKGLDFQSMFVWLSQSMTRVSSGKVGGGMTDLPPVGWGQISS